MSARVTAPLVVVRDNTGQMHHVYAGGLLPDNADPEHVEQLVEDGMVENVKGAKTQGQASAGAGGAAVEEPGRNASREAWATYAKSKGASADKLKDPSEGGLSRDDLRDEYGS
jgi:hypothetical protein